MRLQRNKEERTTNKEMLQYFKSPEIRHISSNSDNLKNQNWNICWLNGWCVVAQLLSHVHSATPWTAACKVSLSFSISQSLLKCMSIELVTPSNHLILCCPILLLPSKSFPASGSFPTSWLFTSGGQSIGASTSVLPVNIQGWYPLGLTGLISLLSKELSVWKHQFFVT